MPAGRPRKTVELKLLQGTFQPCRELPASAFPVLSIPPKPPRTLDKQGKDLWKKLSAMLVEARILSNLDLIALEALCVVWSQCKRFETEGREIPPPYFTQLRQLLAEFGLTPSTRNRIVKGKSEPTNKFWNNGRKP